MLGVDTLLFDLFRNAGSNWMSRRRNLQRTAQVKKLLREKIRRELAVNRAIIDDFRAQADGRDSERAIVLLKTAAMAEIFDNAIDLDELFPLEIPDTLKRTMAGNDGARSNWVASLKTEAQLFERIWLRVTVAQMRATEQLRVGDMVYIHQLMLGLELSLKRPVPDERMGWIRSLFPVRDLYVQTGGDRPA